MGIPPVRDEKDFVDKTVQIFQNFRAQGGGQSLTTRSVKIHRKPIVSFISSLALPSSQTIQRKLADLLFVFKHFLNGQLDAHRSCLVQAKFASKTATSWSIETGQFLLMTYWPTFSIVKQRNSQRFIILNREIFHGHFTGLYVLTP